MPDAAIDAVRDGYEAFNRRDVGAMLCFLAPQIEFRMPMDMTRSAPSFEGHEGIRRFFDRLWTTYEVFEAAIDRISRVGGTIVVTGTFVARTTPDAIEDRIAFSHFWRIEDEHATQVSFHDAANPFELAARRRTPETAA